MGKFKVGDKVRILDGSKIKNYAGEWVCLLGKLKQFMASKNFQMVLSGISYATHAVLHLTKED